MGGDMSSAHVLGLRKKRLWQPELQYRPTHIVRAGSTCAFSELFLPLLVFLYLGPTLHMEHVLCLTGLCEHIHAL